LLFHDDFVSNISKWFDYMGWYFFVTDVQFLPMSGLLGTNMKTRMGKAICPWWNGPCLFEALDAIEVPPRDPKGPFR
jgi:peptide chain release factor subunit 3